MAILPFKMFGQTGWSGERFPFSTAKQRGAFQKGKSNGFKLAEIPCMRSGPAPPDPRTATFSDRFLPFPTFASIFWMDTPFLRHLLAADTEPREFRRAAALG